MNISRIHYLRGKLEAGEINLTEISEVNASFMALVELGHYEPAEDPENVMASDMLDVLEDHAGTVEKTIYNWVKENFGESEANDPSWDIGSLANEINQIPVIFGAEDSQLSKLLGE